MSTYQPNIPTGLVKLDVDYVNLRNNFQQLDTSFFKNHYKFSDSTANNGKHRFVEMPVGSLPVGLVNGQGTLYSKTADGSAQLFYTNGNTGNEYQMTLALGVGAFPTFATNTVYNGGVNPNVTGGWTFLPGAMILNYGFCNTPVNNDRIPFAQSYASFAVVTLGPVRNNTSDKVISIKTGTVDLAGFNITLSGSDLPTGLYWTAIGF